MNIKERFKSFFAPKNKNKPFYAAVITAIIVMDSVFLYQFISSSKAQMQSEFVNAAENVDYVFRSSFDSATQIATSLCMNDELDEFLEDAYRTIMNIAMDHIWFSEDPWQMEEGKRFLRYQWGLKCMEKFIKTPLREGKRRYYDNLLYMFAFMMLSGNYRIID